MINKDQLIQETIDFEGRYHEGMYITIAECKQIMIALEEKLGSFNSKYSYVNSDDLEFARALSEENRLEGVKWLCEKLKPHTLTPLKDAKDILDSYC